MTSTQKHEIPWENIGEPLADLLSTVVHETIQGYIKEEIDRLLEES